MKSELKIGYLPILDHLVLGVAERNSGRTLTHTRLTTKKFETWDGMIDALEKKRIDGMFILFPLALQMKHTGAKIKIVLLGQREGQVLVGGKGMTTVQDLKGGVVHVPSRYSVHYLLVHRLLKEHGLNPESDVQYQFGFSRTIREMLDALRAGKTRAFISAEPLPTLAQKLHAGKVLATSATIKTHHICCVLVLCDDVIAREQAACQEFVDNLVKAGMFMNAYPRQAAEIGESFIGYPKKIILEALTHDRGHILFWDLLPRLEDFDELQRYAIRDMHLWNTSIDLTTLVDTSFAQRAYREWTIDVRHAIKDRGEQRTLPGSFEEGAQRIQRLLGEVISIVGMRRIRKGGKLPYGVEQSSHTVRINDIEEALYGKESVIRTTEMPDVKAFYFFPSQRGNLPDRVLLAISQKQGERTLRALHFGEKVKLKIESDVYGWFNGSGVQFFKRDRIIWCALDYLQFRFLALLLEY